MFYHFKKHFKNKYVKKNQIKRFFKINYAKKCVFLVEFEIRHQRLVLEDRRHSDGDQSREASSAEKYSN